MQNGSSDALGIACRNTVLKAKSFDSILELLVRAKTIHDKKC